MSRNRQKKPKRPPKQVVLFIVEGQSDTQSLLGSFEDLYEAVDPAIRVEFTYIDESAARYQTRGHAQSRGDITSKHGVDPDHILKVMDETIISPCLADRHLNKSDIIEVVQITDLDGAYVPDEVIVKSEGLLGKPLYRDGYIEASSPQDIAERNERKRDNIDFLLRQETIDIPKRSTRYSLYFFSSNLDHYLHHDANASHKMDSAVDFSIRCERKEGYFKEVMCGDSAATQDMTYEASWDYAREGMHSLERHTNLNILIERIMNGDIG